MWVSTVLLFLLLQAADAYVAADKDTCDTTSSTSSPSNNGVISRHLQPSEYHILLDDSSINYVEYKRNIFLKNISCSEQKSTEVINVSQKVPVQKAFGALYVHYKPKMGVAAISADDTKNGEQNVLVESESGVYTTSLSYRKHPALFFMLNGRNEGVFISYKPGQLYAIALKAGAALGVKKKDLAYPLRLFDVSGRPLDFSRCSCESLQLEQDILHKAHFIVHLLLEKELFVWPGISLGFEWTIAGSTLHTMALEPKVILARNFVPDALCDTTVKGADSAFARSPEKHYSAGYENYRTSQTATTTAAISRKFQTRAAILGRLPNSRFVESLQLLKYDPRNGEQPGQWYKPHHDFYHQYDSDPARIRERILKLDHGPAFRENATYKARYIEPNRFLTFFPYLNNVEEGGETVFPTAVVYEKAFHPVSNRLGMPECSEGLSIVPTKGAAALFYALQPDGSRDYSSRHGGCPPEKGVKHAANLFTWNYEIDTLSPIIFG